MSSIAQQTLEAFNEKLNTPEGKSKLAAYGGDFVRDRLREISFARHIMPPITVTKDECQRSVNHDTLVKIVDVEPNSRAMVVDFRGQPDARFISAPRAEMGFFTISSEKFEKTEQELLAYDMNITKVIEDNGPKDMQEVEDREFLRYAEAAVQGLQTEANPTTTVEYNATNIRAKNANATAFSIIKGELALAQDGNDFVALPGQRPDFVNTFKLMDTRKLRSERILIGEGDHDDILQWTVEDMGNSIQSETMVEGYKHTTLLGRKVVRTIKTDILRPGNVYVFAAPEFLGRFYILNKTKFYVDKVGNLITWWGWEDIAMSIINVAGVVKLELYAGSVRPTATDTGYEAKIPVEEDELGAENNRVDDGLVFPSIKSN